jgi:hypothetical protein
VNCTPTTTRRKNVRHRQLSIGRPSLLQYVNQVSYPNGSEPQHRSQRQRHRDALHHNNYLQQQQQQQQQQHQNQHSDGRQPHVTVGSGRSHAVVVGSDLPAIERIAASMAMLDIERTDAGFGDVGIPLSTRARVTRSSYRLDEIAEEATATLSPVASNQQIRYERIRRSRYVRLRLDRS